MKEENEKFTAVYLFYNDGSIITSYYDSSEWKYLEPLIGLEIAKWVKDNSDNSIYIKNYETFVTNKRYDDFFIVIISRPERNLSYLLEKIGNAFLEVLGEKKLTRTYPSKDSIDSFKEVIKEIIDNE